MIGHQLLCLFKAAEESNRHSDQKAAQSLQDETQPLMYMTSAVSMTGSLFKSRLNYRHVRKTQSRGHHPALLHAVMWLAHSWAGNRKSEENRGALQVLLTH